MRGERERERERERKRERVKVASNFADSLNHNP